MQNNNQRDKEMTDTESRSDWIFIKPVKASSLSFVQKKMLLFFFSLSKWKLFFVCFSDDFFSKIQHFVFGFHFSTGEFRESS